MTSARWLRRLLTALLVAYPLAFRHEDGADVVDTHVDRYRSRAAEGGAWRAALFAGIVADMAWGAAGAWWEVASRVWGGRPQLKHACRSVLRRPALSVTVVVMLALGIGANTAIFSLADAVLLRPLPVADPCALVAVYDASNP
jgi:hypothetical protein